MIPPSSKAIVLLAVLLASAPSSYSGESVAESETISVDLRSPEFMAWLGNYYSQPQIDDKSLTDSLIDSDGDGQSNYFEYLAQLSPTDSTQRFRLYFADDGSQTIRIGPIKDLETHTIEYSAYLKLWLPVQERLYQVSGDEIHIDLDAFSSGTFFRVQLSE